MSIWTATLASTCSATLHQVGKVLAKVVGKRQFYQTWVPRRSKAVKRATEKRVTLTSKVAPMDWIQDFYTATGRWWGPAESSITERDRARARTIRRLAPDAKRILELGASYGNTAAACAEDGLEVVAVEISERLHFARQFQHRTYRGSLEIVHADFFEVHFGATFDAVTYWNGFGVGTDADQRRLLTRIAEEWLPADGVALLDIANPFVWASWAGTEEHKVAQPQLGYHYAVSHRVEFDPVHNRFVDIWWQNRQAGDTP